MSKIIEVDGKKFWAFPWVCGNCTLRDKEGICSRDGYVTKELQMSCSFIYTNFSDKGFELEDHRYPVIDIDEKAITDLVLSWEKLDKTKCLKCGRSKYYYDGQDLHCLVCSHVWKKKEV